MCTCILDILVLSAEVKYTVLIQISVLPSVIVRIRVPLLFNPAPSFPRPLYLYTLDTFHPPCLELLRPVGIYLVRYLFLFKFCRHARCMHAAHEGFVRLGSARFGSVRFALFVHLLLSPSLFYSSQPG